MVVTHAQIKKQKKRKFHVKEDDPRRLHMSKAQALEANRKLREDRLKIDSYAEDLKKEREDDAAKAAVSSGDQAIKAEEVQKKRESEPSPTEQKITKLKKQLAEEKGPGSRARKEAINKKIKELTAV